MILPSGPACTEKDVWRLAWRDYEDIAPANQVLAAGADGVLRRSDPWTLASPSTDFVAQGVTAGRLVRIVNLADPLDRTSPNLDGDILEAVSASSGGLLLKRPELAAGTGLPPGNRTNDSTELRFLVGYIDPQIDEASRFVDLQVYDDTSFDSRDAEWRRQVAIYGAAWEQARDDVYAAKMNAATRMRDRMLDQFRERSRFATSIASAPMNYRPMHQFPLAGPRPVAARALFDHDYCSPGAWSWAVGYPGVCDGRP